MLPLLITTALVVAVSALCSLAEAVLYSVPASYVEQLRSEGRRTGEVLAELRGQVDRPITAILTVNTVANTAGAAVAGAQAAVALGEGNVVLFSAALTIGILLFSEILPKTIGVVYSRALGPWLARPLQLTVFLLSPFIALISLVTRLISRGKASGGVSQDEIVSLARMGHRSGSIDADEAAVIQNVLALSRTTTRSVMTPRTVVFTLEARTPVREAQQLDNIMVYSRIPVYAGDADDIVGVAYRRDVLSEPEATTLELADLVRPVAYVGEHETVDRVLELLLEHRRHMLVVLDEFGGFAGVVTLEDVMEEILGKEIVDEFDVVADMRELAMTRRKAALARMRRGGDEPTD